MRMSCVAVLVALGAQTLPDAQFILAPGELRNGTMKPGEQQTLVLALEADECARLELDTKLALSITLRKPGGSTLTLMDVGDEEWTPAPLTIVAAQAGRHVLELRLSEKAKGGTYTLRFDELGPTTERDRKQAEGEAHLREGIRLFQLTARESRLAAVDHYTQAAEIFTALDNQPMLAKSIAMTGLTYNRLGETRLALEASERALGLYRTLGLRGREAAMLNNIGVQLISQGRYADAIEQLKTAEAIFHEIGDDRQERLPISNLGLAYGYMGEVETSITYYRRALKIAEDNADESGEAFAYLGLGGTADLKGNVQDALTYFARALDRFRKLGNHHSEALALGNIGSIYLRFSDGESALDYYLRAQEVRKLAPNRVNEANLLGNIARAYALLGQLQKANEFTNTELRFWREIGNKASEANALNQLGSVQWRLGDLDAAAALFESALALARESRNRPVEARALVNLSRIRLRQASIADAVTLAVKAVAVARDGGLRPVETDALVALARAEAASGALDAAREHATEAVGLAESIRSMVAGPDLRTVIVREKHAVYDVLADVLMRLHRQRPGNGFDRQAFGVSERARARTLLDLIGESRSNIREGVDPALLSREQTLRAQLTQRRNDSDERVESLLIQFRELQNEMRVRNPRYASLVEPPVADADTVQRELLDRNTALVEYRLGEERSYAWIIDTESITAHELPPRARIEALARRAHDALSRAQAPGLRVALQELSDAIVTPLGPRMAGTRLAIVTEGTLQYIPFAALPDAGGRPLIASHEIVSLPSASTLGALRASAPPRAAASSVFVVGDPVFDGKDPRVRRGETPAAALATALERSARDSGATLERLLFTRREADIIASLVPADRSRKLLDFAASLERITNGDLSAYRVVHFATHGLLNNKQPELSGLVFSLVDPQGRPRDGFLPAYEVYNLRLNAELVVLSACQTALGEDIRGEGLVGLTRAFMYAGTPRVVASLWRVPDSATAALMERFYRALFAEKRRPAEALRLAQESVRAERRWSAPYYWAGFTLAGEWK
jgi:CHAT domain-containing protein/tetratricopeptide (TPR) repeat protein